jgi:ribonuclease R
MTSPSEDDLLLYLEESSTPLTKRQLTDAFGIAGDERRTFKDLLRKLVKNGKIEKHPGGTYSLVDFLPAVAVLVVNHISPDGDVFAKMENGTAPEATIEVLPHRKLNEAPTLGDNILARLSRVDETNYKARVIRRLDTRRVTIMGLIIQTKNKYLLLPTNKKDRDEYTIEKSALNGAEPGHIVMADIKDKSKGRIRQKHASVMDIIGHENDPAIISLISAQEQGLSDNFPKSVSEAAEGLDVPELGNREDLRDIPLVTIDGADAKDFDDAVFAERTEDGFHIIVAIADVSYYVRPEDIIDEEAIRRGNSTYFPDRVIPMLPEALSNDLCSLRPDEPRACLAAHLWIDNEGNLTKYKFVRGLMQSKARLIYEQVQAAKDGVPDDTTKDLMDDIIYPLYEAYAILLKNREKRNALELDLPERQILVNDEGHMYDVKIKERLDSHKLIEECMILANVAAARALEDKKAPCVYRVHEKPDAAKFDSLRSFLEAFDLTFPKGTLIRSEHVNKLLMQASAKPYTHLIHEVILRTQSQAHYTIQNKGHFGLALEKYAHFTSPIRRYADLLVHRSLITAYELGEGGLDDDQPLSDIEDRANHISQTERSSITAERTASDRFVADFLADKIGNEFEGRITGIAGAGLFVKLKGTGADAFCPVRTLPNDYYDFVEDEHAMIGTRTGRIYRLGAEIKVRLIEADGLSGNTIVEVVGHKSADIPGVNFASTRGDKPHSKPPKRQGGPKKGHSGKKRRH